VTYRLNFRIFISLFYNTHYEMYCPPGFLNLHNPSIPSDFVKCFTAKITKPVKVRNNKFATKALLCNTQYFYTVDSDMYFSNAQGMFRCLATATMVTRKHYNITLSVNWPCLMTNGIIMKRQSKFHLPFRVLYNSLSFNCHTI